MRICLIGDTRTASCRVSRPRSGHAGATLRIASCTAVTQILTSPYSPDPPELARRWTCCAPSESTSSMATTRPICATGERRAGMRRSPPAGVGPDSPDYFLSHIEQGQAQISATDLEWLRALPAELSLDGARAGTCSYAMACRAIVRHDLGHGPSVHSAFTDQEIEAALSRDGVASADLILCGHTPGPTLSASRCRMDERRLWFAVPGIGPAMVGVRRIRDLCAYG